MKKGFLVLETGDIFEGTLIGHPAEACGEVVFNTSMTGFSEMLTDPGYAGQILTLTNPLIASCSLDPKAYESERIQVQGVVLGYLTALESPDEQDSLTKKLEKAGVTGIANMDTRALIKVMRKQGTLLGVITDSLDNIQEKETWIKRKSLATSINWVEKVSTQRELTYLPAESAPSSPCDVKEREPHLPETNPHVVIMDFGVKKSLIRSLLAAGCQVTVVPYHYTASQIEQLKPKGVILSGGPGDPLVLRAHLAELRKISERYPTLAIGLGHQLLALAYGAKVKKLPCGHRGSNHPVKEVVSGKVFITAQNHGYTLVEESISSEEFTVTYCHVNDGSIEGLKHKHLPITTVQFHPEAHPGPRDALPILTQFVQQLRVGDMQYAFT